MMYFICKSTAKTTMSDEIYDQQKGHEPVYINEQYKTIIMADHDEGNLVIAKNSLDDIYNVFTVPSGKTLFLLLESIKPDLILLDIEISDMDGYEIIDTLKRSGETAHIPLILLFPGINPGCGNKVPDTGATDYIKKPFTGKFLAKRVEKLFHIEARKEGKEK